MRRWPRSVGRKRFRVTLDINELWERDSHGPYRDRPAAITLPHRQKPRQRLRDLRVIRVSGLDQQLENRADVRRCVLVAVDAPEVPLIGLEREEVRGSAFDRRVLPREAERLDECAEPSKGLELVVVLPGPNRVLAARIAP